MSNAINRLPNGLATLIMFVLTLILCADVAFIIGNVIWLSGLHSPQAYYNGAGIMIPWTFCAVIIIPGVYSLARDIGSWRRRARNIC